MAIPKRSAQPGTYFVTTVTHQRHRLFQVEDNARLLMAVLAHYRSLGHYKLFDFVIMPDHIHLILTPQRITLERAMQLIKGGFSHRLAYNTRVWQRGFADRRLRDQEEFFTRREYLRLNPVRARLVSNAEAYPFSSAHAPIRNRTSAAETRPKRKMARRSGPFVQHLQTTRTAHRT